MLLGALLQAGVAVVFFWNPSYHFIFSRTQNDIFISPRKADANVAKISYCSQRFQVTFSYLMVIFSCYFIHISVKRVMVLPNG